MFSIFIIVNHDINEIKRIELRNGKYKNKFTITTKNKAIDKLKSLIFLGLIIIIIAINLNMNIKK